MSNLLTNSIVFRPFHFPWAVAAWEEHDRMHWTKEEIPLGDDISDWKSDKLTLNEKAFVTQILRMFTQSDVNVGGFYYDILIPRFKNNEIRNLLGQFAVREGTHQHAYALLNDTLGLPEGEYSAFLEYQEMKEKHEFMIDADASTQKGLALALAKGVFNEGVSLFASFVMLLNFQRRGLMKGMCKIVEWSIKDETKHVEGLASIFRQFCKDHPRIVTDEFKKSIYEMARECVRLEDSFIDLTYNAGFIEGLRNEDVKSYIRYVADRRLTVLGLKENWKIASNPLPWLDWILNATDHTNFFENKSADYEISGLVGEWDYAVPLGELTIYTKDNCPFCAKTKELLISQGVSFNTVDLSDDIVRSKFYEDGGFVGFDRSMPKIYDSGRLIGGYNDLIKILV